LLTPGTSTELVALEGRTFSSTATYPLGTYDVDSPREEAYSRGGVDSIKGLSHYDRSPLVMSTDDGMTLEVECELAWVPNEPHGELDCKYNGG
jgi:hypothetical protein